MTTARTAPYDAVVLAGGRARRLGGRDKPGLIVRGATLLDTVLAAVGDAGTVVVAGQERPTSRPVRWVREDPPGGGPVAGLVAALPLVVAEVVAVLAADLPFLDAGSVDLLRRALRRDGALLVDDDGRDQLLVGVWRTASLRAALQPADTRMSTLLGRLDATRLALPGRPWFDCDTPADVAVARRSA